MLWVLFHKASRDEFGLGLEQLFITHEAEVIGDIFVLIGFRDVNSSEQSTLLVTAHLRHESICLKSLIDARKYHHFAIFIKLLEGLFVDRGTANDKNFCDFGVF